MFWKHKSTSSISQVRILYYLNNLKQMLLFLFSEFFLESLIFLFLLFELCFLAYLSSYFLYNPLTFLSKVIYLFLLLLFLILLSIFNSLEISSFYKNGAFLHSLTALVTQVYILVVASFVLIASRSYLFNRNFFSYEYLVIFSLALLGAEFICTSSNISSIFLSIELQSLSCYVLASMHWSSEYSTEAGIKYFILGSFSSTLLLFGFSLLYFSFGTFSFDNIQALNFDFKPFSLQTLSLLFIISSLLFKVGSVPFHSWVLDVYDGSFTSIAFFFATLPKIVFFLFIAKVTVLTFSYYSTLLYFPAFLSIFVASFAALWQKRIKRLISFSAISHAGFILIALATSNFFSIKAVVFYWFFYIITATGFFLLLLLSTDKKTYLKYIISWAYIAKRNVFIAIVISLILFSMSGIPPLIGFYSKLLVFVSLVIEKQIFLSMFIVSFSCLSSFYYIRLVKVFFFIASSRQPNYWLQTSSRDVELLLITTLFSISFTLLQPNTFLNFSALFSIFFFS